MTNKNSDVKAIEFEEEITLDNDLMLKFSQEIERVVNDVLDDEPDKDGRIELLTILFSLAAQLSIEMEVEQMSYMDMASAFFNEVQTQLTEQDTDISKLN